ncbi:MAG: bifunctional adenosylcobinamide kinase/adenosylcobinamide-phosphate guanylyltransferase [Rhodoferax sp.]|jgi:adenosylcobinamide kinase/adenosylcobinamide-phosphate guanylyltransferase|uniref:bifunctional adenosylcobinamide kinase/adenosylcobinamide-phosphate guanylyltransferase n=1 Tax=Rhodoferax sp. TaxID=50421 RepID=UPI001B4D73CE|nr:bifunctional adenosylcobinamide kinase/adenosylcobinamide-phosphate guanylyltransferase [Rhodoferax sp.]MBP9148056.1 bifunctional adenosylcobinamide kinase/adenosylcobinamide-phosphate guanylyltransferase [Rhodoferax sp.]MBP9735982.1 bifunctional adenosylcobinamide kinase/adenosylcobinamide-phosphate guanylyltransferase [Rhodoferax sp.]
MTSLTPARSELILGGQKSGKSRRAELLARDWLGTSASHRALLIATAQAWDDEMRQRIDRHQADRAERVPGMTTLEEPLQLAQAIAAHSQPDTLIVVDCLTLWLTNILMPAAAPISGLANEYVTNQLVALMDKSLAAPLLEAISDASGPLVLVGNEIGLGVIPLGREVRAFVDALGLLNQSVAAVCQRVTLMAAGLPLTLKDVP